MRAVSRPGLQYDAAIHDSALPMNASADLLRRALTAHRSGDLDVAATCYHAVLANEPRHPHALHMLGMLRHQQGRHETALELLGAATAAAPESAPPWSTRAAVWLSRREFGRAQADARASINLDPEAFGGWINLGLALAGEGRLEEATGTLRHAARLRPDDARSLLEWALAAARCGQCAGLAARAATPIPALATWGALALEVADALADAGESTLAYALLSRLRGEMPSDASVIDRYESEVGYLRAAKFDQERRSDDATDAATHVLGRAPQHRGARLLRAELALERGEIAQALADYRELLDAHPADAVAASSRLIALQHDPDGDADSLAAAHRDWGARFAPPAERRVPVTREDAAPLRVGWLSPRFASGVVATFFARTFGQLDRATMQHVLYDSGRVHDAVSDGLRAAAYAWEAVADLDDLQLCEKIRADRIDVLVDLSGHSPGNRLRAFAARPAPVQISWLDYFHSTGTEAIDDFISDAALSPASHARHYSERVVQLPSGRICHAPLVEPPTVHRRAASPLRFASYNRLAKVNDTVLALWARLLDSHPGSVLRLKNAGMDDAQMRARFLRRCVAAGLRPERLELHGFTTHLDTLNAYADVDIALDTFPFSGCATSCDALSMGVPVVTWYDDRMASRQTLSLLRSVGLEHLAAIDADGYWRAADALAKDAAQRAEIRTWLPQATRRELGDFERHAAELSAAIRAAWLARLPA